MKLHLRIGTLLVGLSLVGVVGILPSFAQDPANPAAKPASTQFRRVPPYFGKAGATPEQKERIYVIRAKHQEKIADLKRQIEAAESAELAECEAVLLESQRRILVQLRTEGQAKAKSRTKAARAEAAKAEVKSDK